MNWKQALEDCPVGASLYAYANLVHADDQPQVSDIPGDIESIQVDKAEEGKYSILLTIIMQDKENLSEEELVKRLRILGANPDRGWE